MPVAVSKIILELLIALGVVVTAADVGKNFDEIYEQQTPAVQQQIDSVLLADDILGTQAALGGMYLTHEAYEAITDGIPSTVQDFLDVGAQWELVNGYMLGDNYYLPNGNYVTFDVIQDGSAGITMSDGLTYYQYRPYFSLYSADGVLLDTQTCLSTFSWGLPGAAIDDLFKNIDVIDGGFTCTVVTNVGTDIMEREGAKAGCSYMTDTTASDVISDTAEAVVDAEKNIVIDVANPDAAVDVDKLTNAQIMELLRQIVEDMEKETTLNFGDNIYDITVPELVYDGTLSEFAANTPKWTQVFPFCLPWDLVRGIKLLSAEPVAPVLEIPFDIPEFGFFGGYSAKVTIDFKKYDKYFYPLRWLSTIMFVFSLIFVTFKIVKGAK